MGLGHFGGGVAAARWLAAHGAQVTVTDVADEQSLADSLACLVGARIAEFHLGGHRPQDFARTDLVVVNPAVRPGNPLLDLARAAGARLTTEIELFVDACPAKLIGVTGSNGKSTTAGMIAAILQAQGIRTWLGGNIGLSLLDQLDRMTGDDWVVLEVSSFQLRHAGNGARMPHVAVVTNCTPNHLDWHESFSDYVAAKQRILTGQADDDLAVLNTFDPESAGWDRLVRGQLKSLPPLESLPELSQPGQHNRINAACAAAAATAAGCGEEAIRGGLSGFRGLPQRLEWFAVVDGRLFYNDSTATTPESTVAALESLDGRVWLLAGGRDKGFDSGSGSGVDNLVQTTIRCAAGAAFFGSVANMLRDHVAARDREFPCASAETMEEALAWTWPRSRPGDSIVLSPGFSSHDQFQNFRQRGEKFAELVSAMAERLGQGDRGDS
jgi:UDP-N-acetylmuramoylalanine--D-glutamate ligase